MAPFEKGIFITQLSNTHNLLFNKFPLQFEHILREEQHIMNGTSLTEQERDELASESLHLLVTT